MPGMPDEVLLDVEERLKRYLSAFPERGKPEFVNSGGSAAIYKVPTENSFLAIKVYNPAFLSGEGAASEKRRLALQKSLIGHDCPSLVKMFAVTESEGTAFIEMDFVGWPQLKNVLENVPDEKISNLIKQLVDAVIYLEKLEIVHRDIKPENIHVSPDFEQLVLIDLGVARELIRPIEDGEDSTDHGLKRPFISTAQYSSPEYLFRLDAPSQEMWKGLNIYQVGAVAHDLINKRPLFQAEVEIGNRWLVARSVLTKTPSFPDANSDRLASLKSIAMRCLVKDLTTRLSIVDWSDFNFELNPDPLMLLEKKIANFGEMIGGQTAIINDGRLRFEREDFFKRLGDNVRTELIPICSNKAPFSLKRCEDTANQQCLYEFTLNMDISLQVYVETAWMPEMNSKSAAVSVRADLCYQSKKKSLSPSTVLCVGTVGVAEEITSNDIAKYIASNIVKSMDMIEAGIDIDAFVLAQAAPKPGM